MKEGLDEKLIKQFEETISNQLEKYYNELIIQNKKYLNKKEACLYLGVSYATAEKYIFNTIPTLRFGKTVKFDKADIDYWTGDNKLYRI